MWFVSVNLILLSYQLYFLFTLLYRAHQLPDVSFLLQLPSPVADSVALGNSEGEILRISGPGRKLLGPYLKIPQPMPAVYEPQGSQADGPKLYQVQAHNAHGTTD